MLNDLTPREREVLALVARGMTNQEIADALGLAEATIRRCHVRNIMSKLYARNRVQLALYHYGLWNVALQEGAQR